MMSIRWMLMAMLAIVTIGWASAWALGWTEEPDGFRCFASECIAR